MKTDKIINNKEKEQCIDKTENKIKAPRSARLIGGFYFLTGIFAGPTLANQIMGDLYIEAVATVIVALIFVIVGSQVQSGKGKKTRIAAIAIAAISIITLVAACLMIIITVENLFKIENVIILLIFIIFFSVYLTCLLNLFYNQEIIKHLSNE